MLSIKSHKTVEQIAKKHRMEASFIQKQLDIGEPIEHEHTQNHDLAKYIALQHLDEIPDYYTRLKKMEADAKKHHKKFKDVKESAISELENGLKKLDEPSYSLIDHLMQNIMKKHNMTAKQLHNSFTNKHHKTPDNWIKTMKESHEEERYCPLCDKRETRSDCSYGEKAWDKVSVKDEEYSMVRSELKTMVDAIKRLQTTVGKGEGNLEAWVQSKITKASDYIDTAADYVAGGEMKEQNLVNKIIGELQEEDPCWKGYTQVGMKNKNGKEVPNCVPSKGVPKAKGYKKEDVTIEDLDGNTFAEVIDLIKPEPIKGFKSQVDETTRLQAQTGNIIAVTLSWRGKYYSLKIFFPQVKLPTRREINDELQKVYPGCNVIYHSVSDLQPGQPLIQAFGLQGGSAAKFGPNKNYVKSMGEEIEVEEDWQAVNRKDKTDGLSPGAVKAYRRENPGSKLQTAVTEKNPTGKRASRRKSFCSRMSGMKSKLTSAKTARDPDSNINKALRRWNCN